MSPADTPRRQQAGRCSEGHARPQRSQRRPREEVRLSAVHEGRGDGREGTGAEGLSRERRRPARARGRLQNLGCGRRRDDDRDGPLAGDLQGRGQGGDSRLQSDGHQAGHREGGRDRDRGDQEAVTAGEGEVDRPGRHHLRQQRRGHRGDHRQGDGEGGKGRRDHGRGGQGDGDLSRGRRGDAVRPRLSLPLLHHGP